MIATIASGGLKAVVWGLAAVGFAGLVLAAMIATPVRRPPELTSVSLAALAEDRSDLPAIARVHALAGSELGSRVFSTSEPRTEQQSVVVPGAAGSKVGS